FSAPVRLLEQREKRSSSCAEAVRACEKPGGLRRRAVKTRLHDGRQVLRILWHLAALHGSDVLIVRRSAGPNRRPSCDRNSKGLTGWPLFRSTSRRSNSPASNRQLSPH